MNVFISYSREDSDYANRLQADLKALGHYVLIDTAQVSPGDRLTSGIESMIDRADAAILLISPDAVQSQWVREEWNVLNQRNIEGPLRLFPITVRSTLSSTIPSLLRARVAIDGTNYALVLVRLAQFLSDDGIAFFPDRAHLPPALSIPKLLSRPGQEVALSSFTGHNLFSSDDEEIAEWIRISEVFELFLPGPKHRSEVEYQDRVSLYKWRFLYKDLDDTVERIQSIEARLLPEAKVKFRPYFLDLDRVNFLNVLRAGEFVVNRIIGFAQSGLSSPMLVTKVGTELGRFFVRYLQSLREKKDCHLDREQLLPRSG